MKQLLDVLKKRFTTKHWDHSKAISNDQNAVPYIPMSKLPSMGTVIPLNLAGETSQAQYKFLEEIHEHGFLECTIEENETPIFEFIPITSISIPLPPPPPPSGGKKYKRKSKKKTKKNYKKNYKNKSKKNYKKTHKK
jgi:hypothetical protein